MKPLLKFNSINNGKIFSNSFWLQNWFNLDDYADIDDYILNENTSSTSQSSPYQNQHYENHHPIKCSMNKNNIDYVQICPIATGALKEVCAYIMMKNDYWII